MYSMVKKKKAPYADTNSLWPIRDPKKGSSYRKAAEKKRKKPAANEGAGGVVGAGVVRGGGKGRGQTGGKWGGGALIERQ